MFLLSSNSVSLQQKHLFRMLIHHVQVPERPQGRKVSVMKYQKNRPFSPC